MSVRGAWPISDDNRRWWVLAAMSGVLSLVVLDETVVGVALATIRPELDMSVVGSHWVVNAYFLTFTCFVAVGGRLGDSLGLKGLFILGAAIFGLASLVAGFAPDGAWLIAARAIQGVGAAIILPASLAMMTNSFPLEERGLAFGLQATIGGTFAALGPLIGGYFSEFVSWRWIFWINLPVVVVVIAIVFAAWKPSLQAKHESTGDGASAIDYRGLVTLLVGLSALVIALMQATVWGWDALATIILFCGGVVLLIIFTVVEKKTPDPLIEIDLLRIATFAGGNFVLFMFQFQKLAVFVFVALYLQNVRGDSPIDAGLLLLIAAVPIPIMSRFAGKVADRFGSRWPLMTALLLQGLALIVVGLAMHSGSFFWLIVPLVIWGAGLPFTAVAARRALMSAVPETQRGEAGGVILTSQMLGGTVGVLCGTVLLAAGDFGDYFLLTGALLLLVLAIAYFSVERPSESR